MQVTLNTLSDVEQEASFVVSPEELQPHFDRAYESYRPKVDINGFRKGHVPLALVKQLYGVAIEYDSLEKIAGTIFRKEMEDRNIEPIGQPILSDTEFDRGKPFSFKVKFELKPAVTLSTYKGVTVEKIVHPVTEEEVHDEVDRLRRINSTSEPAEKVLDENYAVTATVQELDEAGNPVPGRKSEDVRFYLTDADVIAEVKAALLKAVPGNTYEASFEQKHEDHSHKTTLSLAVSKVEKVIMPPFDDELATRVTRGKIATADALKANIRHDIEQYWSNLSDRRMDDDLASEIVRTHEFTVPPSLVEGYLDVMEEDIKHRTRDGKLPKDFDKKKFREENRTYAVWQMKWILLKEKIAEKENIKVEEDDITRAVERDSANMPLAKDQLLAHYRSSSSAQERLLSEKVMAFLKANAKVKERPDAA